MESIPPGYVASRYDKYDKSIPWNPFLGSLNVYIFGLWILPFTNFLLKFHYCTKKADGKKLELLYVNENLTYICTFIYAFMYTYI